MDNETLNKQHLHYIKKMQEIHLCGGDLLSDFEFSQSRIYVYIDSIFGNIFINYMYAAKRPPQFIITDKASFQPPSPLHYLALSISCNQIDNVSSDDIIIIATVSKQDDIYNRISSYAKCKIYFLIDIIDAIYLKSTFLNPIDRIMASNQARIIFVNYPSLRRIVNKSIREESLLSENPDSMQIYNDPIANSKYTYPVFKPHGFDDEYIEGVVGSKEDKRYRNTINGRRITVNQPIDPDGNVYILGNSLVFGYGADDNNTIGSSLQKYLNEWSDAHDTSYAVHSYSCDGGDGVYGIIEIIKRISLTDKDIVLCFLNFSLADKNTVLESHIYWDTQPLFNRPHDLGEVFYDTAHLNFAGYNAIGKSLFDCLNEYDFFSANTKPLINPIAEPPHKPLGARVKTLPAEYDVNKELLVYQDLLRTHIVGSDKLIGAIVMNCNPFTLGHRYLIETASSQVEHLFIFIVEEDKSVFPFADRFELVKRGTSDIMNVTLIPSGKFIISTATFAQYFEKDENNERVVDSSLDVVIFAEKIAPILNIRIRFVGDEPFDHITRQYNAEMKTILPTYGIDVVIIPRKESSGAPISASRVRKLLEADNFKAISDIVPVTTLEYLKAITYRSKTQ